MAYNPNELMQTATGLGSGLRVFPTSIQPKTFKMGTGTLAKLTPVMYEDASNKWILWDGGPTTEVNVITAAATTATDGTFTLTINGETTAAIDHDANAAAIKAAIVALPSIATADLTVLDGGGGLAANNGTATITWAGQMAEQDVDITANFAALVGNAHVLSTSVQGVASRIDGFVWPDAVVLDSDEEVLGQVMLGGRIHYDDIPVVAGYTQGALKAALQDRQVRDSGFIIEGLEGFH